MTSCEDIGINSVLSMDIFVISMVDPKGNIPIDFFLGFLR